MKKETVDTILSVIQFALICLINGMVGPLGLLSFALGGFLMVAKFYNQYRK